MNEIHLAKKYLRQACDLAKMNDFQENLADAQMNLAQILIDEKEFVESDLLLERSSAIFKSLKLYRKQRLAGILKAPVIGKNINN
jgi:hypothetical protein